MGNRIIGAGKRRWMTVAAVFAIVAAVPSATSALSSGLGGQFDGCDANWWAGNNSQTAVISGGANYLTGACQSISIARMYKTSSGQTFRVAYTTDSTPTNGNFAAYSLPIPAGTTYAGVQYVVCGSGPANCAYFQRF